MHSVVDLVGLELTTKLLRNRFRVRPTPLVELPSISPGVLLLSKRPTSRRAGVGSGVTQRSIQRPAYINDTPYCAVIHRAPKLMLRITQSVRAATTPALANTTDTTTALNRITPNAYVILLSANRITPMNRRNTQ